MSKYNRFRKCKAPYDAYKSSGPFFQKKEGRYFVRLVPLVPGSGKSLCTPYARYLMGVKEGRILPREEETDHIDGDRTHDMLINLRIVSKEENTKKAINDPLTKRKNFRVIRFTCLHCGTVFEKERKDSHLANNRHATFCSKECGAHGRKYTKMTQQYEWVAPPVFTPLNVGEPWDAHSETVPIEFMKHVRITQIKYKICEECRKPFRGRRRKDHLFCSPECSQKSRSKRVPSLAKVRSLMEDIAAKKRSWTSIGRDYGVSDNAVRKWAKGYGLL